MPAIAFANKYYEFRNEIENLRLREKETIDNFIEKYILTDDFLYDYMNNVNESFIYIPAAYKCLDLGDNYKYENIFELDNSALVHAIFVRYKFTPNQNLHKIKIKLSIMKSINID